ncbi:MAG TPA: hypothetical protein VKG25_25010 [Bryobacteraceae bacterium]|nr:hypothetical protein [Bryobacteraceae bacterium]
MVFFVAVVVALGALGWTILVRGKDIPEAPPVSPTQHLEEHKAQIYENLRDLQFEYRVGKLSDGDYQKTKLDLQKELAKVMAEIDSIQGAAPKFQPPKPSPKQEVKPAAPELADCCPHCDTRFAQPMKFCGACGKAMVA